MIVQVLKKQFEIMSFREKYKASVQLIRLELAFAAGICVVLGGLIGTGSLLPDRMLIIGFFCGFFIAGSANILNDYFDFEVDKHNAPNRPIPSGSFSKTGALLFSILTAFIGLFLALIISKVVFVFCVFLWLLSISYNWKLKEKGVFGNVIVAVCVASTFILGAIISGTIWNKYIWLISLIAFFIDLGEEIAGDAMDVEGDKLRKTNSVAIKYGRDFALKLSSFSFLTVILISLIPVFLNQMSFIYIILLIIVDFLILYFTYKLLKSKTRTEGLLFMRAIYSIAYLGLAVIYTLAFI